MSALMLHALVYRMRTTRGCFYWIIQFLSLQFCYISALKVDSLYSIEKLCCTLQGLKARFYSVALCSQSLVQSFITIKWGSQPPPVIPQRIEEVFVCTLEPCRCSIGGARPYPSPLVLGQRVSRQLDWLPCSTMLMTAPGPQSKEQLFTLLYPVHLCWPRKSVSRQKGGDCAAWS